VPHRPTILVFDSGLGGLTVLREIVRARPDARYIYVADDAFFPYGQHSEDAIVARVVPVIGELIALHRPELVVIACNTASTLVMGHLRRAFPVPFVGTVPAIKPACAGSRSRRVSVLGTSGTVKREYTKALIRDFAGGCDVTLVGSAHLASQAEAELGGATISDHDLLKEITACFVDDGSAKTDTVVLACTHYPLLLTRFIALAPWPVTWIDPAPAIARRVVDLLGPGDGQADDAGAPPKILYTSGKPPAPPLLRMSAAYFGTRSAA
jgi:glutamate racemase